MPGVWSGCSYTAFPRVAAQEPLVKGPLLVEVSSTCWAPPQAGRGRAAHLPAGARSASPRSASPRSTCWAPARPQQVIPARSASPRVAQQVIPVRSASPRAEGCASPSLASARGASVGRNWLRGPGLPLRHGEHVYVEPLAAPPPRVPHASPPPSVASAPALLSHIDGVVSEMEKELSEDIQICAGPQAHQTTGKVDWLNRQIWAIEQRREACEMRQNHLAQLRHCVTTGCKKAEDADDHATDSNGSQPSSVFGYGSDEELVDMRSRTGPSRVTLLELQQESLKKHVDDLQKQGSDAEHLRASHLQEREDPLRVQALPGADGKERLHELRESCLERRTLRDRVRLAEESAQQDRGLAREAKEAHGLAEDELRELEASSRRVFDDCRLLQSRIKELEFERSTLLDGQSIYEETKRDLAARLRIVEGQRNNLEDDQARMAQETRALRRQVAQLQREVYEGKDQHSAETAKELENSASAQSVLQKKLDGLEQEKYEQLLRTRRLEKEIEVLHECEQSFQRRLREQEVLGLEAHQHQKELADTWLTVELLQQRLQESHEALDTSLHDQRLQAALAERELQDLQDEHQRSKSDLQVELEEAKQRYQELKATHRNEMSVAQRAVQESVQELQSEVREIMQERDLMHDIQDALSSDKVQAEKERIGFLDQFSLLKQSEADLRKTHIGQLDEMRRNHEHGLEELRKEQELLHHQHEKVKFVLQEHQDMLRSTRLEVAEHQESHRHGLERYRDLEMRSQETKSVLEKELAQERGALQDLRDMKQAVDQQLSTEQQKTQQLERCSGDKETQLAEEVKRLQQAHNLKGSELDVYKRKIEEHSQQVKELANQLSLSQAQAAELLEQKKDIEQLTIEHSSNLSSLKKELSESHSGVSDLKSAHAKELQEQAANFERAHDNSATIHKQQSADLHARLADATQELQSRRQQLINAEKLTSSEKQEFLQQIETLRSQLEAADFAGQSGNMLEKELKTQKRQSKDQQDRIAELEGQLEVKQQTIRDSEIRLGQQHTQHMQDTSRIEALENRLRALEDELKETMQSLQQHEKDFLEVSREAEEHKAQKREVEVNYEDRLQQQHATHVQERSVLEAKMQQLQEQAVTSPGATQEIRFPWPQEPLPQSSLVPPVTAAAMVGVAFQETYNNLQEQVSQAAGRAESLLEEARQCHLVTIEAQVSEVLSSKKRSLLSGTQEDLQTVVSNYEEKDEKEVHRLEVAERLEQHIARQRELWQTVEMQSEPYKQQALEVLNGTIEECDAEVELLRTTHGLAGGDSPLSLKLIDDMAEVQFDGLLSKHWEKGFSPLHWAAQHGRRDLLHHLIQLDGAGDLVIARDDVGWTPLGYALKSRSATGKATERWLRQAAPDQPRPFLEADASYRDAPPAHMQDFQKMISYRGLTELAEQISPKSELRKRMTLSDIDVPEKYRQVIAQIDSSGWHSIEWSKGFTLLHWAAKANRDDLCRRFLAQNADPNLRDHSGRTPLDHAQAKNASEALEVLREGLESSRYLGTMQDDQTHFPTHGQYDFEQEHLSVMDDSAVELSVPEAYLKIMEDIDKGGWETVQWARGFTLLHWAAKNNRVDLCTRFLRQGANPNSEDDKGKTPADYATQKNNVEVLEVLRQEPSFGQDADVRTLYRSSNTARRTQVVEMF